MTIDIDAIEQAVADNAAGPKSVSVDGNNVSQHGLADQLDALDRLQEKQAANRTSLPIRLAKIRPGGPV